MPWQLELHRGELNDNLHQISGLWGKGRSKGAKMEKAQWKKRKRRKQMIDRSDTF